MKLLYPEFLWALFAVLIPILIHLFNFKKFKREYFSNVSFLKEVKLETQSKSKLKHLLVLITRVIAIVLMVIAFCQPYIETGLVKREKGNVVGLYIDNSQSMDAKSLNKYLIDQAKESAKEIVQAYSSSDEFQLLTNDFEGKHQRIVSKEEMLKLIEEVSVSASSKKINEVFEREKDLMKHHEGVKQLYWLSDFQKNNLQLSSLEMDSSFNVKMIPYVQENISNIFVDSVWFESPLRQINQDEKLKVRVVNTGDGDVGTKVNLKINGNIKGIINTTISAKSERVVDLNYSIKNRGEQLGEVYISDYPEAELRFDDNFLFSYNIEEKSKVLYLYNQKSVKDRNNILAVYADNENHSIDEMNLSNVDYSKISNYSLIIVDDIINLSKGLGNELITFMNKGGSLLLIPNETIDLNSYNRFFKNSINAQISASSTDAKRIVGLNRESDFYNNVFEKISKNLDLPRVTSYYPVVYRSVSQTEILMTLANNNPFLTRTKVSKGFFYFLSSSLNNTSFKEHALFVPTLLKVAENSQFAYPLFYELGQKGLVSVNYEMNENNTFIKDVNSEYKFIPEVIKNRNEKALAFHNQIKNPGHYQLFVLSQKVMPISYNFNRVESMLDYFSADDLKSEIGKLQLDYFVEIIEVPSISSSKSLKSIVADQKYWKYFIVAALLFLFLEILLIKFLKP